MVFEPEKASQDHQAQQLIRLIAEILRPPPQRPVWQYWGSDMNQAMISEFVTSIREGREAAVTGVDGLRAVDVTVAAYESAGSRSSCNICYFSRCRNGF